MPAIVPCQPQIKKKVFFSTYRGEKIVLFFLVQFHIFHIFSFENVFFICLP